MSYLFTSESVGQGHPDKICDQISDAVLDECLKQDPLSHVACECFCTTNYLLIGGEVKSNAHIDPDAIARNVIAKIGYTDPNLGFDAKSVHIDVKLHPQSNDIDMGVEVGGAGDQGMMAGFACNETDNLMPATLQYASQLVRAADTMRAQGTDAWVKELRPDCKAQVTLRYKNHVPVHIETVVLSQQHTDQITQKELHQFLKDYIITPTLAPTGLFNEETKILINPTGNFVIGGPHGDTGLTGRKIIVDTYGGRGYHCGGAFSGKDATKVDRSAAYMARWIAKHLLYAGIITEHCDIQLAYAIGVAEPVSIYVNGPSRFPMESVAEAIRKTFDLTPAGIIKSLGLRRPLYAATATYGHFSNPSYPWEIIDEAHIEQLRSALKALA